MRAALEVRIIYGCCAAKEVHVLIHTRNRAKQLGSAYASPKPNYFPEKRGFQSAFVFDESQVPVVVKMLRVSLRLASI